MIVYVVVDWSAFEEAWSIIGVFDSKEKADKLKAEYESKKRYRWNTDVEEYTVE